MSIDNTASQGVSDSSAGVDLCEQFVIALFVDGASISIFDFTGQQSTIGATDALAARAESLQFELGEGPHWEALATGRPVLVSDLAAASAPSWPMFSAGAQAAGIRAVFAFPMKIGAAAVGVVDLYSRNPRRLDPHQVSLASSMANRVAVSAVRLATRTANDPGATENEMTPSVRREVHQATGMMQVQLEASATEALTRLRSHAFATNTPIETVAHAVVHRLLDFSQLPD